MKHPLLDRWFHPDPIIQPTLLFTVSAAAVPASLSNGSLGPKTSHKAEDSTKYAIGKVIAPFAAGADNQLNLQPGDFVSIRTKSPTGWWEGRQGRFGNSKQDRSVEDSIYEYLVRTL